MAKSKEQQLKEIEALLNLHNNYEIVGDEFVKSEEE